MVDRGAAIVDVGGESTRPGADPVSAEEELGRVDAGAARTGGNGAGVDRHDEGGGRETGARARRGARQRRDCAARRPGVAGGRRGRRRLPVPDAYAGRAADDAGGSWLRRRRLRGRRVPRGAARLRGPQGVPGRARLLDPGIGFGKTLEHNFELVRRLDVLLALGRPLLVGFSRKSSLGASRPCGRADRPALRQHRRRGAAYEHGATMLRVHDVHETVEGLAVAQAIAG